MQFWPHSCWWPAAASALAASTPAGKGTKASSQACPLQPLGSVGAENLPGGWVTDQLSLPGSQCPFWKRRTEYLPDVLLSVVFQRGEVTEMPTSQLRVRLLRDPSTANAPPHPASPCSLSSAQQNHPLLCLPPLQPVLLLQGINHCGNEIINCVIGSVSPLKCEPCNNNS